MENQEMTKTVMSMEKGSASYKLVIPKDVERKIRYLCQKVWDVEWSGILFYKHKGSFEDETLVLKCVDIFIMDIGSQTYTEFEMSPEIANYMVDNPELLECQTGLIHSHNNMSSFFSGTDLQTLEEEGIDRNHFLSLIVNNTGKYTAAITRKVKSIKTITEKCSYQTFGDIPTLGTKTYQEESEIIEWFPLNIDIEEDNSLRLNLIEDRLEEIKKRKKAEELLIPIKNTGFDTGFNSPLKSKALSYYNKEKDNVLNKKNNNMEDTVNEESPMDLLYSNEFNPETIKSLVLQLLTGSVIIPNTSKIDIHKWIKGMTSLFDRRFETDILGDTKFRMWAEGYIEFLCWNTDDDSLMHLTEDEKIAVCAHSLIKELSKLPYNKYIEKYINILEGYLI